MKLHFSDPVVVAVGPETRKGGWGRYQFPDINLLEDGRLIYTFADNDDSETAYGSEPRCYVSSDGGKTWEAARVGDFYNLMGIRLPNGDLIRTTQRPSVPMAGVKLPQRIGATWTGMTIYRMDEVKPLVKEWSEEAQRMWHDAWCFIRVSKEHPEGKEEICTLKWPFFPVRSGRGVLVPPSPRGRLRIAPDGTLWMPHYYMAGTDPETGAYNAYLCNYLFKSTDYGHTWDLVSWLEYTPDNKADPLAYAYEGFGENDITFCPDGSMIRLIRTDGCYPRKGPSWFTRSTDGGKTWTKPVRFDDHGVYPCLLTLKCGVTLASYGRPGFAVRATNDPACIQWDDPIELVHSSGKPETEKNSVLMNATCGYSNMVALDDRTAAVVYSDFTVKGEDNEPHKCLMFRTVTVEE